MDTLYVRGLFFDEASMHMGEAWDQSHPAIPIRSSSMQNLFIEEASGSYVNDFICRLILSTKGLKSIILKNCDYDESHAGFHETIQWLAKFQATSLEILIYYGITQLGPLDLSETACMFFQPREIEHIEKLKVAMLDINDIRLASYGELNQVDVDTNGLSGTVASYDDFVIYAAHSIPNSIETLILSYYRPAKLNNKDIAAIEDALIKVIRERYCPNLTAIYLDWVEVQIRSVRSDNDMPPGGWFHRTVECGEDHGIIVYTARDLGSTERYISGICDRIFDCRFSSSLG